MTFGQDTYNQNNQNIASDGDTLNVTFIDQNANATDPINNWTSFNIEKDFFNPIQSFTLVMADDRAKQLNAQLQMGMAVQFEINNRPVMTGFIFKYHYGYTRSGGQILTISGQNLLGWMSRAIVPQSAVGSSTKGYHFAPTTTFYSALSQIFNAFTAAVQLPQSINLMTDDTASLSLATGGTVGLRTGTGVRQAKSLQSAFEHLSKPHNNESYLAYALRIAKHLGCNINLSPELNIGSNGLSQTIFVMPPTYNRDATIQFNLFHSFNPKAATPFWGTSNNVNNILDGGMTIDMESQPSVIIMEKNTGGNNTYNQGSKKVVCVNELTGYQRGIESPLFNATTNPNAYFNQLVPNVSDFIKQIVNTSSLPNNPAYTILNPNNAVYSNIPSTLLGLQTQLSVPQYLQDNNAHTDEELAFGVAKAMAEAQDKYFLLNYTVNGFSNNTFTWAPNVMVNVYDETFGQPGNTINSTFWLQKVNFTKTRESGAHTHLQLSLPYTHSFYVSSTSVQPSPASPYPVTYYS